MKLESALNMNNRGYILVGMIFMMILIAVTALGMNRRAGMQARMAANQARSAQIFFGQRATIEHARWNIQQNPTWRTAGEDYVYEGVTYNRKVEDCAVTGYEDAVTVSVTAPGALNPMRVHFRWQLVEASTSTPVTCLYIADYQNHRVRKVDQETGIITTVAGTGTAGFSGDGGPATSAKLYTPTGVFVDSSGNIYIADYNNNRIRKVDVSTGDIDTVAGNGNTGLQDGVLATNAPLGWPVSVFLDGSGNMYFSDYYYHRIRKVDGGTGIITTVAGSTTAYGADTGGYSGDGGPATSAELYRPIGIHVDASGNIYIADYMNNRIRKVDGETSIITTVAGTGTAGYNGDDQPATSAKLNWPEDVELDASGNIYITDTWYTPRIRKVDSATGIITTVAGNGLPGYNGDNHPATGRKLNFPTSVFVNVYGDIYITDTSNHRIRKVTASTGIITTVAGNGSAGSSGDGGAATSAKINGSTDVFEKTIYMSFPPSWGFTLVEKLY